jgi:hypothetical protein
MRILDFINAVDLKNKNELERAKLLCFYHYKETGVSKFTMSIVLDLMLQCGFNTPNSSRLKNSLTTGKAKVMLPVKGVKSLLEFIPAILQSLENEFGTLWNNTETIESSSELIDETKFCGKRNFLDRLIIQINHSYGHNCFDACAVLMRRLFEVLIISSYLFHNIDDEITDSNGNYMMLESLVKKAKGNTVLKIGRIKNDFDLIREVGNYSAHGFTYTAGKKDIDDIKLKYRVMLEELYNKAGLIY